MIAICILVATALFGFTAIQVLLFQFNQSEMEETEWRNQVKAARQQQFQMQLEMMGATYSNSNAGSDDETEDFGDDGTGTDFDQNDGFDDEEDDLEIVEEDEDGDEAAPAPFQAPTHTNHDVTNASVSVAPLHQQQDEHHPGLAIHPSVHVHHIQHTHQLIRRDSGQSDDNDMNCFHFFALANEHLEHIDALVQRERETQATFERAMKTHDLRLSRSSLNARLQGRGGNRQPSHRVPVAHTQYQVHSSNLVSSTGSTTPFAMPPPTPTTTLITPPAHPPFPTRSYTLDINAPVKFHSLTPLHFAAMNASPDFIATLLKNGANINALDAHSRTPLRLATNSRRNDILHLLLSHPDCTDIPDADGTTALRSAVFRSDVLMTRAYLRARPAAAHEPLAGGSEGAEGDRGSGIYALHVCASFGALEMIDLLVEEMGADVDARDSLGRTPLMYAATKGKWEAV
ncbi:ankyrin repeat-containing domain protein, partial [Chytriomyces sp. MP71]